ncbi:MAG: polysaccharide biosynthesis protein, partial [Alphaproteobacteria bacterium]
MITNTKPSAHSQEGLSRLVSLIWQHRFLFTACLLFTGLVAAIGYMRAPKRYHSEAVVALDVRKLQALPSESVMSPLPQESPVLRTEIDIIGSRSMAERVYANLGLGQPAADKSSKNDRFVTASNVDSYVKAIEEILANVRVMNDGRSYTIYISYTAKDPVFAATVANAFANAYIDYQIDLQTTATRRVSDWLGERLGSLQKKLELSEQSAAAFRQKEGLVSMGGTNLQAQQLSGLNTELTSLQARLAEARARLATATEVLQTGEGVGLTEVLSSPTIQLLRAEEARVIRSIADLDQSGARMNPQRPQLGYQLASLKSQIRQEVMEIVASLRNEIDINQKQQSEVYQNLQDVQRAMSTASMATVHAGQLEREANANRSIYETYLARYKQMIEQDGIATAEARII